MEDKSFKMKSIICLLNILLILGCNHKSKEDTLSISFESDNDNLQLVDTTSLFNIPIDSMLLSIKQIIDDELTKANLIYAIKELQEDPFGLLTEGDDCLIVYSYQFKESKNTEFYFYVRKKETEQSAKEEIRDNQRIRKQMLEDQPGAKMIFFSFRVKNRIYIFNSSMNISHIQSKIFARLIKKNKIEEEDISRM